MKRQCALVRVVLTGKPRRLRSTGLKKKKKKKNSPGISFSAEHDRKGYYSPDGAMSFCPLRVKGRARGEDSPQ